MIGVDDNAPYAVYHDVAGLAAGTPVEYRAIVTDVSGNLNAAGVTVDVGEVEEPPGPGTPVDAKYAVVHYQRADGDYDRLDARRQRRPRRRRHRPRRAFVGEDDYGRFAWVELEPGARRRQLRRARRRRRTDPDDDRCTSTRRRRPRSG